MDVRTSSRTHPQNVQRGGESVVLHVPPPMHGLPLVAPLTSPQVVHSSLPLLARHVCVAPGQFATSVLLQLQRAP